MENLFVSLAGQIALLAEDAPAAPEAAPGGNGIMLVMVATIGFLFYFMIIRPQRKEQAKRQDMLGGVKKNDRVITIGGIRGVVASVNRDNDEIVVKVDETSNTKLKMTVSSIARIVTDDDSEKSGK